MVEHSFLHFVTQAGPLVKAVMGILLVTSIWSWAIILQRWLMIRARRRQSRRFEKLFWSGQEVATVFSDLKSKKTLGLARVFVQGYNEYLKLKSNTGRSADDLVAGVKRAMQIATAKELDQIEQQLSFLATIGSTAPYVGLFGTVWGIMGAFQALGKVQQATIAMVAPGISEALVATALGLFVAIPAVVAYNRLTTTVNRLANQWHIFQDEFVSILYRQF